MRILAVDVGTGTQDIFLLDTQLDVENGFKLVMPSPTMMVHRAIREATQRREAVLLTGLTMGGGPSQWAAEAHARAGLPIYATPDAARSFNDDLDAVAAMGITVISEDEAARLPATVRRITLQDFDFRAIAQAFTAFGVSLQHLDAIAVAVFDHGAAPPHISDRQFRFDYLDRRIREANRLSAFAYPAEAIPSEMTRLQAVARSAAHLDAPLIVMDTAPAAVLGATLDPTVAARSRVLIVNVGNFHTLAFRLGPQGIEGVFEHHTGLLDRPRLEQYLRALADGSLRHETVFADHGHGALVYTDVPLPLPEDDWAIAVVGPRRNLLRGASLRPYFAVPYGDMMLTGCFGLLRAVADLLPELGEEIQAALKGRGRPPWEVA